MIGQSYCGGLIQTPDGGRVSLIKDLYISNKTRNPKVKGKNEFVNNVVYNWGVSGFVGGHSAENHYQDVINNYFIAGPNSNENFLAMFTTTDHVYHQGNYVDMNKDGILNGRLVVDSDFVSKKVKPAIIVDSNSVKGATLKNELNFKLNIKVDAAADAYDPFEEYYEEDEVT